MNQVVDNYWTGKVTLEQVCAPTLRPGSLLVETAFSLISAGTERMKVQQAQMSLVEKARARPDQVSRVLEAVTRDGVLAAYEKVMNRLKTPVPLGYSLSGRVIAVGDGVRGFAIGDRVAGAGASANHAEYNLIPQNLCCLVPDGVPLDMACCATVGAIALQGVRQACPLLGDVVVVIGLGLVGQFSIQLLGANGCKVLGLDLEASRLELALSLGADFAGLPEEATARRQVDAMSGGVGADIVIVTASSTTADPVQLAARLARDRARIVDLGKTKLELPWEVFYEKELELRMSRSYGPGRYDPSYEEKGVDYPVGYVRWTEKRNMEFFLQLMAEGKVRTAEIINRRFPIANAETAYERLLEDRSALGIVLDYPAADGIVPRTRIDLAAPGAGRSGRGALPPATIVLGVIGAGNHAKSMLLPGLRGQADLRKKGICAATSVSATDTAGRFRFEYATTDAEEIVNDPEINTVFIATRHDRHAALALAALRQGKAVFVEKPLAIREADLGALEDFVRESTNLEAGSRPGKSPPGSSRPGNRLMVGYNRRFAPQVKQLARWMQGQPEPWIATYRVSAGTLPLNHWYFDPEQGGGRLLGEVCHFVDLLIFLFASYPQAVESAAATTGATLGRGRTAEDNAIYSLRFASGSLGQIVYSGAGDASVPKERLEVIGNGAIATLENFRRLSIVQNGKKKIWRSMAPDKGHRACLRSFLDAVRGGREMPIAADDLFQVSHVSFELARSLQSAGSTRELVNG